jgi:hypothetical protein
MAGRSLGMIACWLRPPDRCFAGGSCVSSLSKTQATTGTGTARAQRASFPDGGFSVPGARAPSCARVGPWAHVFMHSGDSAILPFTRKCRLTAGWVHRTSACGFLHYSAALATTQCRAVCGMIAHLCFIFSKPLSEDSALARSGPRGRAVMKLDHSNGESKRAAESRNRTAMLAWPYCTGSNSLQSARSRTKSSSSCPASLLLYSTAFNS